AHPRRCSAAALPARLRSLPYPCSARTARLRADGRDASCRLMREGGDGGSEGSAVCADSRRFWQDRYDVRSELADYVNLTSHKSWRSQPTSGSNPQEREDRRAHPYQAWWRGDQDQTYQRPE